MFDIVRDSAFAQIARVFWPSGMLAYEDKSAAFGLPAGYHTSCEESKTSAEASDQQSGYGQDVDLLDDVESYRLHPFSSREPYTQTHADGREEPDVGSYAITPVRTVEGITLVNWYANDDQANPQNWSSGKKIFVSAQICMYTFSVYIGSSLYTASIPDVMQIFGIGDVATSLDLTLYVLAYGIGHMLWSPLSEIPIVRRNWVYVVTYIIFVCLCVATSLVNNFPGLLVLRFLLGFFGSPCLATGGASFGDMYSPTKMPYVIAFCAGSATLGPALGPVIAGFAAAEKDWRWSSLELLWLCAPILLVLLFCLPETSQDAILLRRAPRLRWRCNKVDLRSQSEIDKANLTGRDIIMNALLKPWQVNMLHPAVLFTTVYTALVYGIFYSFFESLPLVYPIIYGFNLGQTSLPFLVVLVALGICIPAYSACF